MVCRGVYGTHGDGLFDGDCEWMNGLSGSDTRRHRRLDFFSHGEGGRIRHGLRETLVTLSTMKSEQTS